MLSPAYKLAIGDQIVDTTSEPQASTLTDLVVELDMDVPADRFDLVLAKLGSFDPRREDAAVLALGYADDNGLVDVMTGTVDMVKQGVVEKRITGLSAIAVLLRSFTETTFENTSAGEIVQALADQAGVAVATAEAGTRFPAYAVDGRRSFHQHMRELAALSGFDLYVDSGGELVFKRFAAGNRVHLFEYGQHILALDIREGRQRAGRVEAWGESPGAGDGSESWAWLTKDFDALKGDAGGEPPRLLLERPVLRTAEAAQTAADALLKTLRQRALRGRLLSLGRPQVKLGDAVRLSGVADESLNQTFQVRSVTHRLNKCEGFVTEVGFRPMN